ncbi:hypothetical protein TSOC_008067 [Tetrabaena socialis]|uniref:ACT domain-containing protein n=1 Tax=Tetrabaena socialis TaxID=47790 RepID=A0A2J7ZZG6_9CHLO|nr:hypothetical protein TSOC_008067 [Tetrabaena socialis]|eukprot:PNH05660.1 hypothetical protein TSOC_008067 [Tetrabaena socialis]
MASGRKRTKGDVASCFLSQLAERGDVELDAALVAGIRQHFDRLPSRYALDVNVDGLDVLSHKRLLDEARADPTTVSFAVRPVEIIAPPVSSPHEVRGRGGTRLAVPADVAPAQLTRSNSKKLGLSRPAFGSSPNLQALALEVSEAHEAEPQASGTGRPAEDSSIFYEITIASVDQPKLLSRLSEALGDLGLNIREAHAFNTNDGFSLDVFVVDQWQPQVTRERT